MNNIMPVQAIVPIPAPRFTQDEISQWMRTRIAEHLKTTADEIEVDQPFAGYGFDSVSAVGFSSELEEWLQVSLPPTLTWDYPTIELLAQHLASH